MRTPIDLSDLTKLHTKQLMAVREAFMSSGATDLSLNWRIVDVTICSGYRYKHCGYVHFENYCVHHEAEGLRCVSMSELKVELDKREHVPNRKEARAVRQQMAKRRIKR